MEGHTALTTGLTSQIINVPAAVLLSGFTADWRSRAPFGAESAIRDLLARDCLVMTKRSKKAKSGFTEVDLDPPSPGPPSAGLELLGDGAEYDQLALFTGRPLAQGAGFVETGGQDGLPLLLSSGVLHQGDHLGSGEHGQQAAAHGGGGVLIVDHARGAALASYSNGHEFLSAAPFAGRITDVAVDVGDNVAAGTKLATLVDDSQMCLTQYFSYA